MGKQVSPNRKRIVKVKSDGTKYHAQALAHGTYRCKRKPGSKFCK